jgi:hypothetical protein
MSNNHIVKKSQRSKITWKNHNDNNNIVNVGLICLHVSSETVVDWFSYLQEIQNNTLISDSDSQIHGENCKVQINEAKFWLAQVQRQMRHPCRMGGFCYQSGEIIILLCPDNNQDSATLTNIIKQHIMPRTTVITDSC